MSGTLYLVATPIGNLEDITLRALRILREVDLIAAEDTRVSGKLLKHYEIKTPMISYYQHNQVQRGAELLAMLHDGKNIAMISDAGTPAVCDPGSSIAMAAITEGLPVVAIPGASALLAALVSSGLDSTAFCFGGFLPRQKKDRRNTLLSLSRESRTMIFYEAPHRVLATLKDMAEIFGAERAMAIGRELTKLHEELLRGSIIDMLEAFSVREPKGEFVLIVSGAAEKQEQPDAVDVEVELKLLLEQGLPRKEAARILAEKYGLKVREVYDMGLRCIMSGNMLKK